MIEKIYSLFSENYGVSTDSRNITSNSIFFALKGENFNGNKFAEIAIEKGASYAIIDEQKYKTSNQTILVNNVLETLQRLATYHRTKLNIPIISLTGSNGKTTTKELIHAVLSTTYKTTATKGNLNNHIGVPLTLLSMTKETEIGITELGANHPNEIADLCKIAKPDYGYITNFGKAHLEGFGSIENIIKAKTELYDYLKINNKTVFINENDDLQLQHSKGIDQVTFGTEKSNFNIEFMDANPFVKLKFDDVVIESKLIGNYNYNNIAAAIAIGKYFKVPVKKIKNAIENYIPDNNRSQIIHKKTNKIILDAYNANPTSMECAIVSFQKLTDTNKIAILGDMFELGKYAKQEHQKVVDLVSKTDFKAIFLVGENFIKTISNSKRIRTFSDFQDFKKKFDNNQIKNTSFLIKGSRGMALERILDLIK